MRPLAYLTNTMLALMALFIGCIIGKMVEKTVKRMLHELEVNTVIKKIVGVRILVEEGCSISAKWIVYVMASIIALKQLGIETLALNILFGGIILFVVIALLLALRDAFPNAIGGIIIFKRGTIKKGDVIMVKDITGKVLEMSLLQTIVETKNGDIMYVPNAALVRELFQKKKMI